MRVLVKGREGRWRASCVGGARSGDSRRRTDVVGVSWDPYPVPSVAAVAASSVARHAIDATPAGWRSGAGSSPLNRPSTTASSPRNDFVKNYQVHPTHWLISTQVLVPVGAGPRPRGRLAHTEAAVHAVIRCGRGETLAAEPGRGARVLAFCLRVGVGVHAAHAVFFFVTLGTVSSTYRGISLALGLRRTPSSIAGLRRACLS